MQAGKKNGRGVALDGMDRYEGDFVDGRTDGIGSLSGRVRIDQGVWMKGCFRDGDRRAAVGVRLDECR